MLKKSIALIKQEVADHGGISLKRTLGPFQLILIGVGLTLGAGLFSITGLAAANYAGPAVTISFIIAAVGCGFAALCYAEFASMIPVAGSAYTYAYATMGEWFAWIIGWDLVLEYSVGCATVAISWSQYLTKFLGSYGLHLPPQLTLSPFETAKLADGTVVNGWINIPGALIVILMTLVVIRGTKDRQL
ncbi:amino acid permease [Pedobacter namyangjuensis]|uniref:amino acid permease n=1 Tax=Pedobacter namyangjuensis TaxID=600626 RepID=UPI0037436E43